MTKRDTLFISHATPEDNDFTIWLASRLQLLGYKVWLDKNGLLGGEKFWEEIDQTIRHKAIKVLLVYTQNICQKNEEGNILPGKLKDGIYKEYSLAESIGKQQNLTEFIILLNKDGIDYNLFIGADRSNQIPFFESWAEGLKQLEKKLIKDQVSVTHNLSSSNFSQWYQQEYIVPNPVIQRREIYYSNIWPITKLPESFYIHQFKTTEQADYFYKNYHQFPISKISNYISSFESDLFINSIANSEEIIPEKIREIPIVDIFRGIESSYFPTQKDAETHFKYLLRRVFHLLMKKRGLSWYDMANRQPAYYYTPGSLSGLKVQFEYPYRPKNTAKKRKNLIGTYLKTNKWHFALSAKPILTPILGFQLKSRLTFTTDGFQVWRTKDGQIDTDKIHSHRRKKGKTFFNEEWRDLILGFLQALKNDEGLIVIPLSTEFTLQMFPDPQLFWSDFGYLDPKDPARQAILSTYEEEDDQEEDLNPNTAV